MSEEIETDTQTFDSSSESIELRLRQETEMEPAVDDTTTDELTLRSVDERIKQATDPIPRRVEELCALLASRTEMESAGNSEASGSRPNRESSSRSRNRYDKESKLLWSLHCPKREYFLWPQSEHLLLFDIDGLKSLAEKYPMTMIFQSKSW